MSYNPNGIEPDSWRDTIGEGWHPLVETFLRLVDWDVEHNNMPPITILQVKEKFGGLRIYYTGGDKTTDAYLRFAELMSQKMCEVCGAPAIQQTKGGWIRAVCDDHV